MAPFPETTTAAPFAGVALFAGQAAPFAGFAPFAVQAAPIAGIVPFAGQAAPFPGIAPFAGQAAPSLLFATPAEMAQLFPSSLNADNNPTIRCANAVSTYLQCANADGACGSCTIETREDQSTCDNFFPACDFAVCCSRCTASGHEALSCLAVIESCPYNAQCKNDQATSPKTSGSFLTVSTLMSTTLALMIGFFAASDQ